MAASWLVAFGAAGGGQAAVSALGRPTREAAPLSPHRLIIHRHINVTIRQVTHTAAALEAASQDQAAAASPHISPGHALAQRNGSCRFEAGVDYDRGGGRRAHATGVASKESCCALCKERPSCGVATYLAASQQCWFKPFLATRRPSQSSAGVVSCILTEREPNESWVPKSHMPVLLSVRNLPQLAFGPNNCRDGARLGSMGIYDPAYLMPESLSVSGWTRAGLVIGNPGITSAWEDADGHGTGTANPGNNVWAFGSWNLLGPRSARRLDFNRSRILAASPASCGIYSASGPLWSGHGVKDFAAILKVLKAAPDGPFVMLGTGAATSSCEFKPGQLPPSGLEALREIDRRIRTQGGFVTVRGDCSKRFLVGAGLMHGVESLGCPSLFINPRPGLGASLQQKYNAVVQKLEAGAPIKIGIMLGYKRQTHFDPPMARFFTQHHTGSVHVMQWPYTERSQFVRAVYAVSGDETVRAAARVASRVFYNVSQWKGEVGRLDLVVGPRIHGSMIAIAAGTPTVTIAFDPRIREFCSVMKLACVTELDEDLAVTIKHVAQNFSGALFDANRRVIAGRLTQLFGSAGLDLNPLVAKLATV